MKLNYKKIVDKKFESVINGYSPTQVDSFLDLICQDYLLYDEKITKLKEQIKETKIENIETKSEEEK